MVNGHKRADFNCVGESSSVNFAAGGSLMGD